MGFIQRRKTVHGILAELAKSSTRNAIGQPRKPSIRKMTPYRYVAPISISVLNTHPNTSGPATAARRRTTETVISAPKTTLMRPSAEAIVAKRRSTSSWRLCSWFSSASRSLGCYTFEDVGWRGWSGRSNSGNSKDNSSRIIPQTSHHKGTVFRYMHHNLRDPRVDYTHLPASSGEHNRVAVYFWIYTSSFGYSLRSLVCRTFCLETIRRL